MVVGSILPVMPWNVERGRRWDNDHTPLGIPATCQAPCSLITLGSDREVEMTSCSDVTLGALGPDDDHMQVTGRAVGEH